jgi:hypothetical protein
METHDSKTGAALALLLCGAIGTAGCGAADTPDSDADGPAASVRSALGAATNGRGCDPTVTAGAGWTNTFFPQSTESFQLLFRAWPHGLDANGHPLIDGVVGLSNGPAGAFGSLGPIIRFNPSGSIDARDGDVYRGGFPYKTDEPYEFQMSVDVTSHRYSVWVRHLDALAKPFELLASDFAFRSEQSGVTRLDNVGRVIDSPTGELETCAFRYSAPTACSVSRAGAWQSQMFPSRTARFQLAFDALPAASTLGGTVDAVIGAANGDPNAFSSLAAIVRFRPDGTIDARNGATYAADAVFNYVDTTTYHITLDIDPQLGRYSVTVKDPMVAPDEPAIVLAHDYAFRSEQVGLSAFDHLGQFVDGASGTIYVCSLTVVY